MSRTTHAFRFSVLCLLLMACSRDRENPIIRKVQVNGQEDIHFHMIAGLENQLDVYAIDNYSLRDAKFTLLKGLHHGAQLPGNSGIFKMEPSGNLWQSATAPVSGKADQCRFPVLPDLLSSGPHTLLVEVIDEEGRMAERAFHVDILNDSLPVIVAAPEEPFVLQGDVLISQSGESLDLSGYAIDLSGLALFRVEIAEPNGVLHWVNEEIIPALPNWAFQALSLQVPSEPGEYRIHLSAINTRGQSSRYTARLKVI